MDEIEPIQRKGQHVGLDELVAAVPRLRLDVHTGE